MNASIRELQERVSRLERDIQELKVVLEKERSVPWWQRTAGMFKDDKVFEEIVKEMEKARKADYEAVCREIDAAEKKERTQRRRSLKGTRTAG
jgi:hypothetical protein